MPALGDDAGVGEGLLPGAGERDHRVCAEADVALAALPSRRILCAQDFEKPPVEAGFTRRLRPCPPRPSP